MQISIVWICCLFGDKYYSILMKGGEIWDSQKDLRYRFLPDFSRQKIGRRNI